MKTQSERRVALVTGCGKRDGMGQAIARTLAASGAAVVVSDVLPAGVANQRQERLGVAGTGDDWRGVESLVEEIEAGGGTASSVVGDIGEEDDARRMVGETVDRHGGLDILVNNAAAPQGPDRQDVEDAPIEAWDRVIRVNLRGTYLMSRFAVPVMRKARWGRIVNISSMAGMSAAPAAAAYSASKAGVLGLTRSLAMDLAPWGITVNAICPGLVGTSRAVLSPDPALDDQEVLAQRGKAIAVGRVGLPEDIAGAVAYLASDAAGYVTAQTLVLDGGGFGRFPVKRPDDS
ncbi:SDR family NAD(P)-dependent oxidoreductase [Amycolatopsis pigmentata]|uniref:SDR family NAD(P)-dependent oxidoreductase n=1 Tax=Amycolatopsis pigmentata TaxID=450801 RepID=A0ABW5FWC9_9PSEU